MIKFTIICRDNCKDISTVHLSQTDPLSKLKMRHEIIFITNKMYDIVIIYEKLQSYLVNSILSTGPCMYVNALVRKCGLWTWHGLLNIVKFAYSGINCLTLPQASWKIQSVLSESKSLTRCYTERNCYIETISISEEKYRRIIVQRLYKYINNIIVIRRIYQTFIVSCILVWKCLINKWVNLTLSVRIKYRLPCWNFVNYIHVSASILKFTIIKINCLLAT